MRLPLLIAMAIFCLCSNLGTALFLQSHYATPNALAHGQHTTLESDVLEGSNWESRSVARRNQENPDVRLAEREDHQAAMNRLHTEYKAKEEEYHKHVAIHTTSKDHATKIESAKNAAKAAGEVAKLRKQAESHATKLGVNDEGHAHQIKEWKGNKAQMDKNAKAAPSSKKANPGKQGWHAGGSKKGGKK